ncbi:MAG TPA: DUF484 family protein [Burkholderiaceae bacterium]|nr:DUF484 family protein [Burkholderiaceae bacterium]
MTAAQNQVIDADQVAIFLREHPEFFEQYSDLLASITVPHPHGGRAVSLVERQVDVLREKVKLLELRMAELLRNGQENDAISERLSRWTRELLRARDPRQLPEIVTGGLAGVFAVPQVALRLWALDDDYRDLPENEPVGPEVMALVEGLKQPYCGPNAELRPAAWLAGGGAETRSIALLPLRVGASPDPFGLLVLGSPDPERFQTGMGLSFLSRIAETASAALSKLR